MMPITDKIAAYLRASCKGLTTVKQNNIPQDSKNNNNILVNRISHTHHVPHAGYPHTMPVTKQSADNKADILAKPSDIKLATGCFHTKYPADVTPVAMYDNIPQYKTKQH